MKTPRNLKALSIFLAALMLAMSLTSLAGLVTIAFAADNVDVEKIYAYAGKVSVDGEITVNGASIASNAGLDADKNSVISPDHAIEFVMENAIDENVVLGATYDSIVNTLYLAIKADAISTVVFTLGGIEGAVKLGDDQVSGFDGSDVAWNTDNTVLEIALPMDGVNTADADGFTQADLELTVDRDGAISTFKGAVVLTAFDPIVAMNAGQNYSALKITTEDIKNTPKSGAGTYYRYWVTDTSDDKDFTKPFAMHAPEGKSTSTRSSFWLFGYNPMYFDLDADAYIVKSNLKFNDLPAVDKSILSSVSSNKLPNFDTNPYFLIFMSNLRVDGVSKMISAAIYNTADGLQMVFNPESGDNTVVDLGVNVGEEFELMLVSEIDENNEHPVQIYVNGDHVQEVKGMQVAGNSLCEAGWGFNCMTNCEAANAWSVDVNSAVSGVQYATEDAGDAGDAGDAETTTPVDPTPDAPSTEDTTTLKIPDKLYAYAGKVTVDGTITVNGASLSNNAALDADKNSVISPDHAIEFVMENAIGDGVVVGATYNDVEKMLYLAVNAASITNVMFDLGGVKGTVKAGEKTVTGIDGSQVAWNDDNTVVEIAIPMTDVATEFISSFDQSDFVLTVTSDAEAIYKGTMVFTSIEPIMVINDDQDFSSMKIATEDVKITPKSGAGTYYRFWQMDSESGCDFTKPFTMHAPAAKNNNGRSSFLLFGYNPMYFELDADAYVLKAGIKINDLPAVDEAILSSVNINTYAQTYDANPHFLIYMSNLCVDGESQMISAAIYNTAEGLKMVLRSEEGINTVVDLGVKTGESFELMLVSEIDEENAHPVLVYVNGEFIQKVSGVVFNSDTGNGQIAVAGWGFNCATNCEAANAWSVDVSYALSGAMSAFEGVEDEVVVPENKDITIHHVAPSQVDISTVTKGVTASVVGTNFTDAMTLTVGGKTLEYKLVSDTMITFTVPEGNIGLCDVTLTDGNSTAKKIDAFKYYDADSKAGITVPKEIKEGEEVKLPIYVTSKGEIISLDIKMMLDKSLYSSVKFEKASTLASAFAEFSCNDNGVATLVIASTTALDLSEPIGYLVITPNETEVSVWGSIEFTSVLTNAIDINTMVDSRFEIKPVFTISGKITYYAGGEGIPGVKVTLSNGMVAYTDENGVYEFTGITDTNVTVTPYLEGLVNGAVSATDASEILVDLVADSSSLTELQLIAADVDGDGKITAHDAAYILQKSAGIIEGNFPGIDAEWIFNGESDAKLMADKLEMNFTGILLGDVTGDWTAVSPEEMD